MAVKFYIVSVMFNAQNGYIDMLKQQSYQNFHCVLVDDLSTDESVSVAAQAINHDPRFSMMVNSEKKYKVRNMLDALASVSPDDKAVNMTLFKGRLKNCLYWRNTRLDQLLEPSAQYLRRMDTKSLFFPMLEMSGDSTEHAELSAN